MEVLSSRTMIVTDDLERARAFYEGTLGLSLAREFGAGGSVSGVVLFLGGGFLELSLGPAPSFGRSMKLWLQVSDLADVERHLRQAGVLVLKGAERMPWGLDELWIEDPHGIEVRLIEVPPEHPLRRRID